MLLICKLVLNPKLVLKTVEYIFLLQLYVIMFTFVNHVYSKINVMKTN